jgi:predicted DNA-binding WGR domain protein
MTKLYKKNPAGIDYHEAWVDDGEVIEHWGRIGTNGESLVHPLDPDVDEEENLEWVLSAARERGFEEIEDDDHQVLIVECTLDGFGDDEALDKRHRLEEALDEALGRTGLGHCDGGSIGGGSMEACCLVVDFQLATKVIREVFAGTDYANISRIYEEGAE